MEEVWKNVVGYEGLYQVSSTGRVKNTKTQKILKPWKNDAGYFMIKLPSKQKKRGKSFRVHRLVAMAFIDNPNNLPFINHKDEDPSNNNVENLEWCTNAYNLTYGTCVERRVKTIRDRYGKWPSQKEVYQFSLDGQFVAKYDSVMAASQATNIPDNFISSCCHGWVTQTKGFIFVFEKDIGKAKLVKPNRAFGRKPIQQYDTEGNLIETYNSAKEASFAVGVTQNAITRCARGESKTCCGFIWKYI